ncbi:OLC1v1014086C2 [Oldenlandia corymbosa var. corymbosa]|nr:OLC1v1014086C2 [Oldenlandia corymbosa var. corymbosa]
MAEPPATTLNDLTNDLLIHILSFLPLLSAIETIPQVAESVAFPSFPQIRYHKIQTCFILLFHL